jgi:hypothetical protein
VLVEMVTLAGPMISELAGSSGIARRAASTAAAGSPSHICRILRPSHVSGSFAGDDLDSEGQLSSFSGEVTGFTMSYSGGSIVAPFSMTFADLFGLVYDLNGGPLGDGTTLDVEGIGAVGAGIQFLIGPGPVGLCGTGAICGTITGPAVPEPATWAMMIAGFGLVGGMARRRRPALA